MCENSNEEKITSLKTNYSKSKTPPPTPSPLMTSEEFTKFWDIRPKARRINKLKAEKLFYELPAELIDKILHAVSQQREHVRKGRDPKRIPHPTTWLNGRRWEDEIYTSHTDEQNSSEA